MTSTTSSTRSSSPELEYPYTHQEFDALSLSEFEDSSSEHSYTLAPDTSGRDYEEIERVLNLPSPFFHPYTELSRSPSPLLFPLDMEVDYAPNKVFLSPLSFPLPLPTQAGPPVCGMCDTPPHICEVCAAVPQIARRSAPIQDIPECTERIWARVAAIQTSMVGATTSFLSLPIRESVARVADFIFRSNLETSEEIDPENPVNTWGSQVSDETWDNTPSSSDPTTSTSDGAAEVFRQFTNMSVSPDRAPLTPPPSPANDWSSTAALYDDHSSEEGEVTLLDEHLMPAIVREDGPLPSEVEMTFDEYIGMPVHPRDESPLPEDVEINLDGIKDAGYVTAVREKVAALRERLGETSRINA